MDKAPDAFRTISEVADDLDIPQHVLRFWETRFTQIKPMKRSGGRRYYRPDDVDLLRGIRRLLYGEGYTIRGVQRILKENGIKSVQGLVDGHAAPSFAPMSAAAVAPRVQAKRPVVEEEHEEEELEDEAGLEEEIEEEAEDEAEAEDAEDEEEEGDEEDGEDEEEGDDEEAEDEEEEEEEEAAPAPVAGRREPPMTSASPRVEPQLPRPPSRANPVLANPVAARPEPAMSAPAQSARPAAVPETRPNPQRRLERERLEAVLEELLSARRALDTAMKDG
ncbi:MerR HTH family regulatory protein [Bradyrhizobium sp. NFR13]|uniref:MerR family transcriptional regulator n=1 Tax=Bradyrhizobium sp. NFR13 TaxID=1566285 RepID=UPI0008EA77E5|nr:MerR family transcriptional regulator [Bradyrhizobium sp. NFR13]SFM29538.1 MerR HTH family regulatory protein [Bradyrhizobium sp. NFR13]